MNAPAALLETTNLGIQFGGLVAVSNFQLCLMERELVGLIGPNGAGKTTVFNMLTGVYPPTFGTIHFCQNPTANLKPFELSRRGMTRTFQNIRLFKQLSVLDNIRIAFHQHTQYSMWEALLISKRMRREEKEIMERSLNLLKIFGMEKRAKETAGSLSCGEQRRLEILRALATEPKLVLLDEPAAGMNHSETHTLMETIHHIRDEFHVAILLIEHDMKLVMGICERILVLDHGVTIYEGTADQVQNNSKVIEAYLGCETSQLHTLETPL
jgi:branched-chain amino acid transport system ATP-binding protein